MGVIRILTADVADKIAAGEVVERPASVVKELVENSIDAGSRHIRIALEKAGRMRISVSDDGCGMDKDDLARAWLRHATSKITAAADLDAVRTLGFRGEALASIAAVSRLTISTCAREGTGGWQIRIEGGQAGDVTPLARQSGTTVEVRDLFFNTPARRKFLKSDAAELFLITRIIIELGLAYPAVAFTLGHEAKEIMRAAAGTASERIPMLLGREISDALLPVRFSSGPLTISGNISKPGRGKANRSCQYVFVNQRPVVDKMIYHAVSQAYQTLVAEREFPPLVLFITTPPEFVDVNVHPHKREIRFQDGAVVHEVLVTAMRQVLTGGSGVRPVNDEIRGQPDGAARAPTYSAREPYAAADIFAQSGQAQSSRDSLFDAVNDATPGLDPAANFLALDNTFLVLPDEDGLRIIDQHAAHERIVFEELQNQRAHARVERQALLLPVVLELDAAHYEQARRLKDEFQALGFEIEEFGGRSIALRTYPSVLGAVDVKRVFEAVLADLSEHDVTTAVAAVRQRVLASVACHAAVRGHERLSREQVAGLFSRLKQNPVPAACPHGRPFEVVLGWEEIRRRFKRT